jgi:hypothetical protein
MRSIWHLTPTSRGWGMSMFERRAPQKPVGLRFADLFSLMTEILDLFGDPVSPLHRRRGRPPHVPTAENRSRVNMMVGWRSSNERIAGFLRCDLKTLCKHYFRERLRSK